MECLGTEHETSPDKWYMRHRRRSVEPQSRSEEYGMELSDEEVAKLLAKDIDKHKSKDRNLHTNGIAGGRRRWTEVDIDRHTPEQSVHGRFMFAYIGVILGCCR